MKLRLALYRGARRVRVFPGASSSIQDARRLLTAAPTGTRIEIYLDGSWGLRVSLAIGFFCDHVMDEFGSTCPDRIMLSAPSVETARILALQRGWLLGGADARDLCPRHSGRPRLTLTPESLRPRPPARLPDPIHIATNVQPIRPKE